MRKEVLAHKKAAKGCLKRPLFVIARAISTHLVRLAQTQVMFVMSAVGKVMSAEKNLSRLFTQVFLVMSRDQEQTKQRAHIQIIPITQRRLLGAVV